MQEVALLMAKAMNDALAGRALHPGNPSLKARRALTPPSECTSQDASANEHHQEAALHSTTHPLLAKHLAERGGWATDWRSRSSKEEATDEQEKLNKLAKAHEGNVETLKHQFEQEGQLCQAKHHKVNELEPTKERLPDKSGLARAALEMKHAAHNVKQAGS